MTLIARPLIENLPAGLGTAVDRSKVRTLLLLAGGASLGTFSAGIGRSILDMPVATDATLLSLWRQHGQFSTRRLASAPLPMRIVGCAATLSSQNKTDSLSALDHVQDPQDLRGTGGILHDLTVDYPDDAYILVASAATILFEPLEQLVDELLQTGADAAFFVYEGSSASGLMLLRCGCLRSIPAIGFVDLKEQAMPLIASSHSVTLVRRSFPVSISVRTPMQYILGLRAYHQQCRMRQAGEGLNSNASESLFAEQWRPLFQIVEPHARVGEGVRLHDAVVLNGATVGNNAVVVRSVVCPGAVVPANARIVDQLVRSTNDNRKPNLKRSASDR